MLARRALSMAEMKEALARGGFEEQEIDAALERLAELRFLDDQALAERVVEKSRRKGLGWLRIEAELRRRGLTPPQMSREDEEQALDAALCREFSRHGKNTDWSMVGRFARRLVRKGFDPHDVRRALESRGLQAGFDDG